MAATQIQHLNGFEGHSAEEIDSAAGHPLLKAWNPPTQHSFSKTQMKILTSLCDAFSPSINYPVADSAPEIAGLLSVLLKPKLLAAIRVLLWLLSTGLGTVILGGRASLIWQFPFCQSFSNLPRSNQETILRRWSLSVFAPLRAVYKLFKMITMWAVYTKIEKNGRNRNWNGIGYCGSDPNITKNRKSSSGCAPRDLLKDIVIETEAAGENLVKVLDRAGVAVLDDVSSLTKLATKKSTNVTNITPRLENPVQPEVGISCDVVVVGSGCGGGVAASVLAKAGYKVIILEKGKYFATEDFSTLEGPSQMAMFEKLGSLATEDGGVNLVAGATVGGGTTINWSVCFETPPPVLQEWKDITGLDLFTSAPYQLAMREVWRRLGAQPHVAQENLQNSVLRAGCVTLGEEVGTLARNTPPDHDCGWCTSGCPRGQKRSTATTWLLDAAESGNAVIMSECEAKTIQNGGALLAAADFKERMARFSRTVTLCVVTRDESSGHVSVEADGTPVITYTLNAADEETALVGIEKGLRVLIAAGATEIGTHQQDGERFSLKDANPSDIEAYFKRVNARGAKKNQISMGSGHHMSSCKMGSDPQHSVVDGEGESWEVEGLFLSDGSILPNAVGVNPMVTIQSLAYCTAHSVLQSLQSHPRTSLTKNITSFN